MGLFKRWSPPGGIGFTESQTHPGRPITDLEIARSELKHLANDLDAANRAVRVAEADLRSAERMPRGKKRDKAIATAQRALGDAKLDAGKATKAHKGHKKKYKL